MAQKGMSKSFVRLAGTTADGTRCTPAMFGCSTTATRCRRLRQQHHPAKRKTNRRRRRRTVEEEVEKQGTDAVSAGRPRADTHRGCPISPALSEEHTYAYACLQRNLDFEIEPRLQTARLFGGGKGLEGVDRGGGGTGGTGPGGRKRPYKMRLAARFGG